MKRIAGKTKPADTVNKVIHGNCLPANPFKPASELLVALLSLQSPQALSRAY